MPGLPHQLRRPLLAVCLWLLAGMPAAAADRIELHLVLAIDMSASVNDAEFDLQRTGTARAFLAPAVIGAIEAAPGGIAVTIIQWSSITQQAMGLDWVVLTTAAEIRAYADRVAAMPRRLPGGGTMIHAGLEFASHQLAAAPGDARRRVIDLASNGETDDPGRLAEVRDRLLARGIVINGLAIEEDSMTLTDYFRREIIGGPGAFAVTASDFDDIERAMRLKLFREISGPQLSSLGRGR